MLFSPDANLQIFFQEYLSHVKIKNVLVTSKNVPILSHFFLFILEIFKDVFNWLYQP